MKVPRRIATVLINSLKGGVVPRIGLPYIAVGRREELEALLHARHAEPSEPTEEVSIDDDDHNESETA